MAKRELSEKEKEEARVVADRKNIQALAIANDFQAKQIEELQVQVKTLGNNLGTLILQFQQFQEQRIRELKAKVNGGPTA